MNHKNQSQIIICFLLHFSVISLAFKIRYVIEVPIHNASTSRQRILAHIADIKKGVSNEIDTPLKNKEFNLL